MQKYRASISIGNANDSRVYDDIVVEAENVEDVELEAMEIAFQRAAEDGLAEDEIEVMTYDVEVA